LLRKGENIRIGVETIDTKKDVVFKNLILFSIFRAFYGIGILIITWFLFQNNNTPIWFSPLFLIFSIFFSRFIFKKLKVLLNWE
tara:strand:+ start:59 stop:310 length:252 start_codon:yes stop_codon:yes gene_type:complete